MTTTLQTEFRANLVAMGGFYPTKLFHGLYGKDGVPQPLPKDIARMEPKMCFANAMHLARKTGLSYVEGIGRSSFGFDCDHAWCEDANGNVIDPTWDKPEDCLYIGHAFETKEAWKMTLKQGYYGLIAAEIPNVKLMEQLHPGFIEQLHDARRNLDELFEQARQSLKKKDDECDRQSKDLSGQGLHPAQAGSD